MGILSLQQHEQLPRCCNDNPFTRSLVSVLKPHQSYCHSVRVYVRCWGEADGGEAPTGCCSILWRFRGWRCATPPLLLIPPANPSAGLLSTVITHPPHWHTSPRTATPESLHSHTSAPCIRSLLWLSPVLPSMCCLWDTETSPSLRLTMTLFVWHLYAAESSLQDSDKDCQYYQCCIITITLI